MLGLSNIKGCARQRRPEARRNAPELPVALISAQAGVCWNGRFDGHPAQGGPSS